MKLFLTPSELETAFDTFVDTSDWVIDEAEATIDSTRISRSVKYYPHDRFIMENYVLLILERRRYDLWGRNYTFLLRTYSHSGAIISTLEFAKWDDDSEKYHAGELSSEMRIALYDDHKKLRTFRIGIDGGILP